MLVTALRSRSGSSSPLPHSLRLPRDNGVEGGGRCCEGVTVGKVSEESIGLVQVFEVAFALRVCVCVCVCVYVCMSERVRVSA